MMISFHSHHMKISFQKSGPALTLGYTMTAAMLLCTAIGYVVGKKLGHQDVGIVVGLFLGLGLSGYEVYKVLQQLEREDKEAQENEPEA